MTSGRDNINSLVRILRMNVDLRVFFEPCVYRQSWSFSRTHPSLRTEIERVLSIRLPQTRRLYRHFDCRQSIDTFDHLRHHSSQFSQGTGFERPKPVRSNSDSTDVPIPASQTSCLR